jgi:hypothetical protein
MRVIGEIFHPDVKITIFYMNQKYLVKFEQQGLEQTYKISEFDYMIQSVEDIKKSINENFIHRVMAIFAEMNKSLSEALKDYS